MHDLSTSGPPGHRTLSRKETTWRSTEETGPMTGHADLVRELKSLRKGRGLYAGSIEERVGPALRSACAVTDGDGLLVIRQKVAARLTELAEQLPEDLRVA